MNLQTELERLVEELRSRPMTQIRAGMSFAEIIQAARDSERVMLCFEIENLLVREKIERTQQSSILTNSLGQFDRTT